MADGLTSRQILLILRKGLLCVLIMRALFFTAFQASSYPVIHTHPLTRAGKKQGQAHNEIGGGPFDAVIQRDETAVFRQPAVVAVLTQ